MINIASLAEKLIEQNRNPSKKKKPDIHKNNFKFFNVIGKGGFGRVWKIQSKKTKQIYALKEMSKLKIIDKKSEKSINSEREFLAKLNHPFIVNMHYAFQDKDNLYLVMDLLSGGDLRYHVTRYRKFSEEQTRFFIANMVYALQYIHEHNVIHRDLKPENLVLDEKGYLRITDFGIAKENQKDNSSETSGTPGYMAPEVMQAKNHSFSVDFFAVGVIGYEFMLGERPFNGKNRKEIKEQMLSTSAKIKTENIPEGWSSDSAEFINLLLKRKEEKRLGYKEGAIELMNHSWLKYYPWTELKNKKLLAPYIPEGKENFDRNYCEIIDQVSEETQSRYDEIYRSPYYRNAFIDFYFNGDDEKEKMKKEKEEQERKEKEEKEEKEKKEKDESEKIKDEEIMKVIEENERFLKGNKNQNEQMKSPPSERNVKHIKNEFKYNNKYDNPLSFKSTDKYELQDTQSANNKKNRTNYSTNKNNTNDKNIKEKSNESSMNISKQYLEKQNKKINNLKKPLGHSYSTRDINSAQLNMLKKNIKLNSKNIQVKPIIKQHQKSKTKINNNNLIQSTGAAKGVYVPANININNYYTNNIYNAIYNNNNYLSHLYNKSTNMNKKSNHQRPSSVLCPKRTSSKLKSNKNRAKGEQSTNIKNKINIQGAINKSRPLSGQISNKIK